MRWTFESSDLWSKFTWFGNNPFRQTFLTISCICVLYFSSIIKKYVWTLNSHNQSYLTSAIKIISYNVHFWEWRSCFRKKICTYKSIMVNFVPFLTQCLRIMHALICNDIQCRIIQIISLTFCTSTCFRTHRYIAKFEIFSEALTWKFALFFYLKFWIIEFTIRKLSAL